MIVWLDGELVPIASARVSPLDRGLMVGDGVFETLRVYRGMPFAWSRATTHVWRPRHAGSASSPLRTTTCARPPTRCSQRTSSPTRACASRSPAGESPPGSSRVAAPPTVIVGRRAVHAVAADRGGVIVPVDTQRTLGDARRTEDVLVRRNVRALAYAEARGASEALFAEHERQSVRGDRLERVRSCSTARLVTPPPSAGCLSA